MNVKPSTPQSIGQVLDSSFRLAAASFRHTWGFALLAGLAGYAAAAYQFMRGDPTDPAAALALMQDPVYWTLYVCGIVLSVLFSAAIYLKIDSIAGGEGSGESALTGALRRLPQLVVWLIVLLLALMIGFLLLLIPGLILMVSLMLSMPILLLEDKGPIASLTSSHRLVWGHWWRTAAILTVAGFIVIVLYFVLGFVAAIVAPLLAGGVDVVAGMISMLIVFALLGVLITPFFASLILNIYWDLKLRKEGGDLALRAQTA